MDRKHCRERMYFFLCFTGLIFVFLASCSSQKGTIRQEVYNKCTPAPACPKPESQKVQIVKQEVIKKEVSLQYPTHNFLQAIRNSGDFEAAIKRSQEKEGDEALFDTGLVYLHPGNSKKDYRKSMEYFRRLVKEFPNSLYVDEAKVWIGVLEDIEKAMKVDIEIEEKKKELSK